MKDDTTVPTCPFCGVGMIEKPKVLERKKFECPCCGHANLVFNRVDNAILNGKMDNEITKQMSRDLRFRNIHSIPETEFKEEI